MQEMNPSDHMAPLPAEESSAEGATDPGHERIDRLATGNARVVFTASGCCMCHVVKQFLFRLGVGPTIVKLDRDETCHQILDVLCHLAGREHGWKPIPAVFVAGKFLGGVPHQRHCSPSPQERRSPLALTLSPKEGYSDSVAGIL